MESAVARNDSNGGSRMERTPGVRTREGRATGITVVTHIIPIAVATRTNGSPRGEKNTLRTLANQVSRVKLWLKLLRRKNLWKICWDALFGAPGVWF
jgi:hypothetical protein